MFGVLIPFAAEFQLRECRKIFWYSSGRMLPVVLLILALTTTDLYKNAATGYRLNQADNVDLFANTEDDHRNGNHPALNNERNEKEMENPNVVWLNPGVLSNLEEFFENLSTNMKNIDENDVNQAEIDEHASRLRKTSADHPLEGFKPSYKIRNYVQSPEPGLLKGTNRHDPSFKWNGLGKRNHGISLN